MKLELGAGYRPTPGFTHNDANPGDDIEIVGDAATIVRDHVIGAGSCDEIRATHLLEHFSHTKTVDVLSEWHSALRVGGTIYLEVPHIFGHIAALNAGEITPEQFIVYVYGDQDYFENSHYAGFNEEILRDRLIEAGFRDVLTQDIGMVIIAQGTK